MSVVLLALAALTYLSRAAGLVFLPVPSARIRAVLNRVPAPLFAGLAALAAVDEHGRLASPTTLAAVLGAVALSPTRSLLKILAGGLVGWAMVWIGFR